MKSEMNNIVLDHHGVKISIAQHYYDGKVETQEAQIIGGKLDGVTHFFGSDLTSFLKALTTLEKKLERNS